MKYNFDIPTIETERLILRGWREEDVHSIVEFYQDEDVTRYLGGTEPAFSVWRRIASIIGHWTFRGFGMFCVEEKSSSSVIGFCGPWAPAGWPENEIGYGLKKQTHGQGYGTEVAVASLKYAYEQLGWKTAISLINPENIASQNVAKKLGAHHEKSAVNVNDFTADIWRHLPPNEFMEKHG